MGMVKSAMKLQALSTGIRDCEFAQSGGANEVGGEIYKNREVCDEYLPKFG
jgi:hypothetical protein